MQCLISSVSPIPCQCLQRNAAMKSGTDNTWMTEAFRALKRLWGKKLVISTMVGSKPWTLSQLALTKKQVALLRAVGFPLIMFLGLNSMATKLSWKSSTCFFFGAIRNCRGSLLDRSDWSRIQKSRKQSHSRLHLVDYICQISDGHQACRNLFIYKISCFSNFPNVVRSSWFEEIWTAWTSLVVPGPFMKHIAEPLNWYIIRHQV